MALRFQPTRASGVFALNALFRGPTGAAATIAVGTTTTGAEGTSATVSNSGTSAAATFDFTIPRGALPAIKYTFSTTTTDADPGAGIVRFNNATVASVTTIYFDNADNGANTVTAWLDSFDDSTSTTKGTLVFTPSATPSAQIIFTVSGTVVDGTGYRKVTVAQVAGTTLPADAAVLGVIFIPTGLRGVSAGFRQTYSATTTDADPGAGIFRLNNATIASATAAYLDNLDTGGTTVSGIIDLWDDSGSTVKGFIRFEQIDSPTIWATFSITGSVVDGTGYRKLTLTSGQSAGAFSGDFVITFSRTGDTGVIGGSTGATDNAVLRADGVGGATLQNSLVVVNDTGDMSGVVALSTTTIELGHASDTTLARSGAGAVTVEGVQVILSGAALGTPASGTLTNCTALPVAGITSSTVTALGVGSLELGHATDTTLARSAAGTMTIEGSVVKTAGLETIWVPATAMVAATTNGAASATVEQTTNKNMTKTLDFDQTTSEIAQFSIAFPKSWNEGTVTFTPHWTAASGAGTVTWALSGVAISNDDPLDVAFGTAQSSTDTLILAYDNHVGPTSAAITIAGTPAEADLVNFKIIRDVADTLSADAKLIGIQVLFTTNAATDT